MKTGQEWFYEHALALTDCSSRPLYTLTVGSEFVDTPVPALVFLAVSDGWQDWNDVLTPQQARDLAAVLVHAADIAERRSA